MTISSTVRIAGPYIGSGAATVFPFAFKVFAAAEMQVAKLNTTSNVETILVLNTDYTVTLNGDQNGTPGGTITLPAVLASGYNLTITSDIANLQPTDLTNQGGFFPEVITDALDRATIQIQQLDQNSRAIKIPLSDGVLDMTTPVVAERASKYLAFDAAGLPVVSAGTGSDSALRTDLANATAVSAGSRLSGFRQTGTGATARTVDAKLKDTVSVKDFGAVGDGVTDDTAAIQAAVNAARTVLIPNGIYKTTSALTLSIDGQSIIGSGIYTTIIKKSFNGTGILITGARAAVTDLILQGTTFTGDGIKILANATHLYNLMIQGHGGNGVRIGSDIAGNNSNSWTMINVSCISNGGHGVYCHDVDVNSNAGTSINLTVLLNSGDGVNIGRSQVNTWVGTIAEGNIGWGMQIIPSINTQTLQNIIGGDFEANTAGQFKLAATAYLNFLQVQCVVVDLGLENIISSLGSILAQSISGRTTTTRGELYTGSAIRTIQRISNEHPNANNRNYAFQLLNAAYGDFGLYQSASSGSDAGVISAVPKLLWDIITGPGLRMTVGVPSNANGINGDICFNRDGAALTTIYHKRAGAWVGIV